MNSRDDEATRYEEFAADATKLGSTQKNESEEISEKPSEEITDKETEENSKNESTIRRVLVGATTGIMVGATTTLLMGMTRPVPPKPQEGDNQPAAEDAEISEKPEWLVGDLDVATSVNDGMTFGEAFSAAREEVGAGGVFEWHGNVYATYNEQEWNNMSDADRAKFENNFSWNQAGSSNAHNHHASNAGHDNAHHNSDTAQNTSGKRQNNSGENDQEEDDIEIISVNHNENNLAQNTTNQTTNQNTNQQNTNPPGGDEHEPQIEILGVEHIDETNSNVAAMLVDGETVVLLDVDNDLKFDIIASDSNHNGEIDDDEMKPIDNPNLTVAALGGFTAPPIAGDLYANDTIDEPSDDVYGC